MLKSAFCISVLLVAANVCYGHGICASFYDQYFNIEHFPIAADGKNDGPAESALNEYKHLHRTTYLNTDRLYSWAYFGIDYDDPANFDVSDWLDYVDCPVPVVRPKWNAVYSSKVETDELLPIPKQQYVAPIKPIVKFNLELPSGYSFQHIPILTHITSVGGLLGLLGDSSVGGLLGLLVIEIYADSPDQPGGILSSAKYEEVLWASVTPGHGFIINMNEPVEVELSGVEVDIDYHLDTGWKLIGLGLDHAFDTVGDLSRSGWNNIDAIGGHGDLFYYANVRVPDDEIVVPSRNDKANPATAYLVYVNNATAAAPGVIREPLNIATTWGALKGGTR